MQVWQKGFQPFPPKWSFFDHGNVPAICQSSAPAKTGPGRGVQHNTNFPYKTLVTLKNSIPSQLYSSTSCKCLPNWPDSPQSDASQAGEVLCKLWLVRISARSKMHCRRSQKPACVKRSQNTLPFQSRVVPVESSLFGNLGRVACSHITERSGYERCKSLFVNSLNRPQMKVMYVYPISK